MLSVCLELKLGWIREDNASLAAAVNENKARVNSFEKKAGYKEVDGMASLRDL